MANKQPEENVRFFIPTDLSDEAFTELLPEFFNEILVDFDSMQDCYQKKDYREVRQMAHKIKGVSSSYGASLINLWAYATQECIDTNQLEDLDSNMEKLTDAVKQTHHYAKQNLL